MPINSASTPPFSQRSFGPVPHAEQVAAVGVEERTIMEAKVEEPIVSEQGEMFNVKLVEDEVSLQQAEVEEAIANKVNQLITYKEEEVPAPLPAHQPITSFSEPLAVRPRPERVLN